METFNDKDINAQPAYEDQPFVSENELSYEDAFGVTESTQDTYFPPETKKKKGSVKKVLKVLLCAALIISFVTGIVSLTAYFLDRKWQEKMSISVLAMNNKLSVLQEELDALKKDNSPGSSVILPDGLLTPAQVYDKNVSAVVAVVTDQSMGSGFIISSDGYVVSNQHVIDGAKSIHVTMNDGVEYPAELIGADATNDVSLLKIDATDLPCVTIGSSDKLSVGDQVAAIGNPLGELTSTLTVGYVSGKDRVVATDGTAITMLQTDAAINSGNSGGPLLDMSGTVVGITTAKYSGTSSSGATIEGISFAIPIDDVMEIVADLQEYGYVKSAYLGVYVRDVDPEVIKYYGFPEGVYIQETMPGLAAEKAGILARDIIVNVGGYDVASVTDLTKVLRKFDGGDETTITIFRNGSYQDLMIILDTMPEETTETEQEPQPEIPATQPGFGNDWWYDYPFFG